MLQRARGTNKLSRVSVQFDGGIDIWMFMYVYYVEWKESIYIPLYKKGSKQQCSNYRMAASINP